MAYTETGRKRQSNPELEVKERLERGHRVAKLCLQVEKYALDEPSPTWEGFLRLNPDVVIASPDKITGIKTILESVNTRNSQMEDMKRDFKIDQKSPEEAASFIFEKKVGRSPAGKVTFDIEAGYVIFYCEQATDYAAIDTNYGEKAGGTQHRALEMNLELETPTGSVEYTPAVLLINGKKENYHTPRVVIHERQHFIYNLLYEKELLQRREFGQTETTKDQLKDEIMAYLRDGSDVSVIVENSDLYGQIFETLGDKYKQLVHSLSAEQAKTPHFLKERARGLIAYQLMLAPVESYPRLYRKLVESYSTKPELMEEVFVSEAEMDLVPPDLEEIPPDLEDRFPNLATSPPPSKLP